VVRALTSHQCGVGSITGLGDIHGLSLLFKLNVKKVSAPLHCLANASYNISKILVYLKADSTRSQVHVFADDTETKALQQRFNP